MDTRQMLGWWLCSEVTERGKTSNTDAPIIFQLDTELCPKDVRVYGRVFNMTINEVDLGDDGAVVARLLRFSSNFPCPREFAFTDRLVKDLISSLSVVKYNSGNDSIYLSNGNIHVYAHRNPECVQTTRRFSYLLDNSG